MSYSEVIISCVDGGFAVMISSEFLLLEVTMPRPTALLSICLLSIPSVISMNAYADVTPGLENNFQAGSTQQWRNGIGSDQLRLADNGGPQGSGDAYLEIESTGTSGAGSRLVAFNTSSDWTGDYRAAGITRIELATRNIAAVSSAVLRMAFSTNGGSNGNWWVTEPGVQLGNGSVWFTTQFEIRPSAMVRVNGSADFDTTFASIGEVRLLINDRADFRGENAAHLIGIDNIRVISNGVFSDDFEPAEQ